MMPAHRRASGRAADGKRRGIRARRREAQRTTRARRTRRARRTSAGRSRPGPVDTVARSSRLTARAARTSPAEPVTRRRSPSYGGCARRASSRSAANRSSSMNDSRPSACTPWPCRRSRLHTIAPSASRSVSSAGGVPVGARSRPALPSASVSTDHPFSLSRDAFHPTRDRNGGRQKLVTQGRDTGESGRGRRTDPGKRRREDPPNGRAVNRRR